jgi:hypothetical protein
MKGSYSKFSSYPGVDKPNDSRAICSTTGKVCFSQRDAKNIVEKYKSIEKNKKPRRFYFCKDCGSYHLTHMLYWDTDEKSKKKIKEKNNFDKNKLKRLEKTWNF